jgi:hypothetical protein
MNPNSSNNTLSNLQDVKEDLQGVLWDDVGDEDSHNSSYSGENSTYLNPLSHCTRVMGMYLIGLESHVDTKIVMKEAYYWLYKRLAIAMVYGQLGRNLESDVVEQQLLGLVQRVMKTISGLVIIAFDKYLSTIYDDEEETKDPEHASKEEIKKSTSALSSSYHVFHTICPAEDLFELMQEVYYYRQEHVRNMHETLSIDLIPISKKLQLHLLQLQKHQLQVVGGSGSQFLMNRLTSSG